MLMAIEPDEAAAMAARALEDAQVGLGEAQVAVAKAIKALRMVEHNFQKGYYEKRESQMPTVTTTWPPPMPEMPDTAKQTGRRA